MSDEKPPTNVLHLTQREPVEVKPIRQCCGNCDYVAPPPQPGGAGECHRYPPTLIPIRFAGAGDVTAKAPILLPGFGAVREGPGPEQFAGFASRFPPVNPAACCGEWKPQES